MRQLTISDNLAAYGAGEMAERFKAAVLKTVEGSPPPWVRIPVSPPDMTRSAVLIKILIVDDHDLVRHGIKKLLEDVKGVKVIGEAVSGEQALDEVKVQQPDVVLMDVKMPGIGGMEATSKLVRLFPDIKILAVTSCDEEPFPSRLLQAGAVGYLTKGAGVDEMVRAIRSVFAGQRYISPDIAQKLALKKFTPEESTPFDSLSERELQVAIMITSGTKVQEISDRLHLSTKTINSYRYRIFEKLDVVSDVELTHLAIRYKLIDNINEG